MASTTAMFTGLTGLIANSRSLDVIGNNIANVNTTAFKSSRMLFATQFSRTLSSGTGPSANSGGTDPTQLGLGVKIAGTQRNFSTGSISPTGDPRDLAIDGNGFFIVNRGAQQLYTRAGSFRQDANNDLVVSGSGERVQGYAVDSNFNVISGALTNINIPIGTLTLAQATRNVNMAGNLNAGGDAATRGSLATLSALAALPTASPPPGGGNLLEPTTRLVDIADPANPTQPLFANGQSFQLSGARKGTTDVTPASMQIFSTSTVQDLMDFFNDTLAIDTAAGNNPDGLTPGVGLDPATGVLSINGNFGTVNNIELDAADMRILSPSGTVVGTPFTPTQVQSSDGESVRTTFIAFDSLGNQVTVNMTIAMENKTGGSGTTWRYFADSPNNAGGNPVIGSGLLAFDANGRMVGNTTVQLTIDRTGTGAESPMDFSVDFSSGTDLVTALASQNSNVASVYQDGAHIGTLSSFSVGRDGVITGGFTNGLTRTLGQVAIATFSNPEGLVETGGNMFSTGPNSGTPIVGEPLELGAGAVVGGALELSNVDLSQEFINLILASTGYSAASRVITTTDQLMQQLLVIGR